MEGDARYNYKGVTNDYIGSGMAYLRYKFNNPKKRDHRRNIDMEQFDPPCCAEIESKKAPIDSKLDSIVDLFKTQIALQNNKIDSLTTLLAKRNPDIEPKNVLNVEPKVTEEPTSQEVDNMPAVFFDFDKTGLDDDALEAIRKVSAKMKADPSLIVEVRGYCDAMGNRAYNEKLSQRRANKVKAEMMKVWGIAGNRIIANGKGKVTEPQTKYRPNRRCDFFFSK